MANVNKFWLSAPRFFRGLSQVLACTNGLSACCRDTRGYIRETRKGAPFTFKVKLLEQRRRWKLSNNKQRTVLEEGLDVLLTMHLDFAPSFI